jgi:hypothetical protein
MIEMNEVSFLSEYEIAEKLTDSLIGLEQRSQIQSLQIEVQSLKSILRQKDDQTFLLNQNIKKLPRSIV